LSDFPSKNGITPSNAVFSIMSYIYLYIDRDRVINQFNREATTVSLRKLETKINRVSIFNYNVQMRSQLEDPIESYFLWFDGHRFEMFAFSLPVIVLGLYLGAIGVDISTSQKRREFGILKSRGASNNQIFFSLIMEAIILGLIAAAGGFFFGIIVSKFIIALSSGGSLSGISILQTEISPDSVILTMTIAVVLMLFASLKPALRVSKTPLTETLHHYSKVHSEESYRPRLDIFIVIFSIFAYIGIVFIVPIMFDIEVSPILYILLIIFLLVAIYIWFPLSPFLMTFSLTRLLTRGTNKTYRFFSYSLKRFTGELWYIIERNITRNPRRVSNVSIIIALTVSFAVLITTMTTTTMHGDEIRINSEIGGDLSVDTFSTNISIENDLDELEGVEDVTAVSWFSANMEHPLWTGEIAVFNVSTYDPFLKMKSYYFLEGDAKKAFELLETGDHAIIGESFAKDNFLEIGDIFRLTVRGRMPTGSNYNINREEQKDFIVAGVVRTLPGLHHNSDEPPGTWGYDIFCDESALEFYREAIRSWRYLINVEEGIESEIVEVSIIENISASMPNLGEIRNREEELKNLQDDFFENPIVFSMIMNIVFMIIIITVGLGLIMSISSSERRNEIATIMARGAGKKQTTTLLLGEAISIMLVGVTIGTMIGLMTGYTFNQMLLSLNFGFDIVPGRPFFVTPLTFIVIGLCVLSLFIAAILTAIRASKIKLHQELRVRGG
jgi:putative ABC transport system permease protein